MQNTSNSSTSFFIAFTSDRTIWGASRSPALAKKDAAFWINDYRRDYPNELRNVKIETRNCSKQLYDIIMQYGSYDKRFKVVKGVAQWIK